MLPGFRALLGSDLAIDLGTANTLISVVGEGLVLNEPHEAGRVDYVLNNSFGMLGINSVVIVKKV